MPDIDDLTFERPASMGGGTVTLEYLTDYDFEFGGGNQGSHRTATVICPGADGPIASDWFNGVGYYSASGFPVPRGFPGNEELKVQSVTGKYVGNLCPGPQAMSGDNAILVVNYATSPFDIIGAQSQQAFETAYPIPWSRIESHDAYEEYPVKGAALSVDRTFKRRVSITEYVIDRGMISDWLGFKAILKYFRNTVNKYTFFNAPPGTMYFDNYTWKPEWDASGLPVQSFRITLREREADWNFVPSDTDLAAWVDYHDFDDPPKRNYAYADWTPIYAFGII